MAITITSPQAKIGFIKNGVSADANAGEIILAAVAAKSHKISHITLNNRSAGALEFTLTGAANLIGPISIGANSSLQWNFNPYMEVGVNQEVTITVPVGAVAVFLQGFTE